MGHDDAGSNGVAKGQHHSQNQPWRSEAISCSAEICWLSSQGEIVQESVISADCSGYMIASVLTQLGAFYEVGFKLTARWQAVSLGGDWTQCKAQLYFSSLTRRRILERIRGDNHKGLRDSQTELRGRAVVTCSNMAKQGSPVHPLPSGA